jgi:hypothetical protein
MNGVWHETWLETRRAAASTALLWAMKLTPKSDEETILAIGEVAKAMRDVSRRPRDRVTG